MAATKVLIAAALPPAVLEELAGLNGEVELTVLNEDQRRLLRSGFASNSSDDAEALRELIGDSEVIYFTGIGIGPDLHQAARQARWIHTTADGVDDLIPKGYGRGSYVFTNSAGPHAISIGEHITMQALMLVKGASGYVRRQIDHKWERIPAAERRGRAELNGATAGIVGLGAIGVAAAERLRALGCRIIATRRSATERQTNVGPADELLPSSELPYLLRESDIVALTLPLTPESHHLIDAEALTMMKPSAFLINISRGPVVDEPALIEALREGRIAGAALDVFDQEPLPTDSPLWDLANLNITPHVSTTSEHFAQRQADLFRDNLRRYLNGEPLRNVVDPDRGY
jgi:phosphoglycerate dehydrogenase-like enzyme